MRNTFLEKIIIGKDVFLKSTPHELNHFKEFINKMDKFDVILDGLNVAYTAGLQHPKVLSGIVSTYSVLSKYNIFYLLQVAAVVSYFAEQNKKILVLGRLHMSNWPKSNWKYVLKHSTVFLTQNLSQDDPYLLYCALNSGKDTIIVTRDLMRGHKFLLKSPKLKVLFNRWLMQRQYQLLTVNALGKPIFR